MHQGHCEIEIFFTPQRLCRVIIILDANTWYKLGYNKSGVCLSKARLRALEKPDSPENRTGILLFTHRRANHCNPQPPPKLIMNIVITHYDLSRIRRMVKRSSRYSYSFWLCCNTKWLIFNIIEEDPGFDFIGQHQSFPLLEYEICL